MRRLRGPSRIDLRRFGGAVLVLVLFTTMLSTGASADTKAELRHAKARLVTLEKQIAAEQAQLAKERSLLDDLQGSLNELATRIDSATTRYQQLQSSIMDTRTELARARSRYERLRTRLDDRARYAYENGPAGDIEFILGSSSLTDLSDRVEFLGQVAQSDADLANAVQNHANDLESRRQKLDRLLADQVETLNEYNAARGALDAKFADQQEIYDREQALIDDMNSKAAEVDGLIAKLKHKLRAEELAAARAAAAANGIVLVNGKGPFETCPVNGPHAYGDSFGAARCAGGYHPHAGNDLMAPRGTPVVAPFAGYASEDPNGLGGNAFILRGSLGYVYGAHLDHYGTMGNVSARTTIGYVGDSGDAQGGPTNLHFEWHPNVIPASPYRSVYGYSVIGSAIDPYPYLNLVC